LREDQLIILKRETSNFLRETNDFIIVIINRSLQKNYVLRNYKMGFTLLFDMNRDSIIN